MAQNYYEKQRSKFNKINFLENNNIEKVNVIVSGLKNYNNNLKLNLKNKDEIIVGHRLVYNLLENCTISELSIKKHNNIYIPKSKNYGFFITKSKKIYTKQNINWKDVLMEKRYSWNYFKAQCQINKLGTVKLKIISYYATKDIK